jgi:glycosyltransferase involved in cell wall biosynthesis
VSASVDPEAGPLTAIEAMSVGVPVVASEHGGVVEVLDGGGLLVPPRDVDALAHAIDRLVNNPMLRRQCGQAGRRAVPQQQLTVADHTRRVLVLLDRALGISGCHRTPDLPAPRAEVLEAESA